MLKTIFNANISR